MTRYLGKAEKKTLAVMSSSIKYFRETIETYEKIKKPKEIMRWLRTANTYIGKAIDASLIDVDEESKRSLVKFARDMNLVCRTNERALLDIQELMEKDTHVSLANDTFLLLCSFAYSTCKTCTKMDWQNCELRKLFIEYDIEPVYDYADNCNYMHTDIKENAYMNLEECVATGQKYRVQPGLTLPGFKRLRTAPLAKEYWDLPKITTNQ